MAALSRIRTALEDGLLKLNDSSVSLVRPDTMFDMTTVPQSSLTIVETYFPNSQNWQTAGYNTSQSMVDADTTIVVIPRSKEFARSLVAEAALRSKVVIVDGSKTDGIESIFKACRKQLGPLPSVSKAHGRMFWFEGTNSLSDWLIAGPKTLIDGFMTTPGVFSDRSVDRGSQELVAALPEKLPARVLDLGAGWGFLSSAILTKEGVKSVDLVEAEALALDCARLNISDPRATFHWGDATTFTSTEPFDAVVMNPPFHVGREGNPALGQSFIRAAAKLLKPSGRLWMVANRHLPYEQVLDDSFRDVSALPASGGFKLFKASRPKR